MSDARRYAVWPNPRSRSWAYSRIKDRKSPIKGSRPSVPHGTNFFIVLLLIRITFCIVSLCWYVFCLLVVLVKLSLLTKWLARKTLLRKPNRGEWIVSTKLRPKSVYDLLGLGYCFIVLCVWHVPWPYMIYFILLWHSITYLCWKWH